MKTMDFTNFSSQVFLVMDCLAPPKKTNAPLLQEVSATQGHSQIGGPLDGEERKWETQLVAKQTLIFSTQVLKFLKFPWYFPLNPTNACFVYLLVLKLYKLVSVHVIVSIS